MLQKITKFENRGGYSQPEKKERSSNLELYRIIVMLLIVAHHYVVNSGLTAADGPIFLDSLSAKSIFLLLFGMWGKAGINCFVLITGYFMCKSKITVKKFAKLLLEIYFYNIIIYLIFLLAGYSEFNLIDFVKMMLPIKAVADGFTSCYLLFFLCIPFLNILVHNMTEKQHLSLLALCCFMYVIIGTIPKIEVRFNYVTWFCVLFFIGSYLRLYPKNLFSNTKLWVGLTAISIIASACSVLAMLWLGNYLNLSGGYYWFVADSNKFLALVTAVTSFMLFKNINIKNSRFINAVASSTFGVLLIHANSDTMRQWLWKDTLNNVGAYYASYTYFHAIASVLTIFVICVLIDQFRIHFVEKPIFDWLSNYKWFNKN